MEQKSKESTFGGERSVPSEDKLAAPVASFKLFCVVSGGSLLVQLLPPSRRYFQLPPRTLRCSRAPGGASSAAAGMSDKPGLRPPHLLQESCSHSPDRTADSAAAFLTQRHFSIDFHRVDTNKILCTRQAEQPANHGFTW